MNRRSAVKQVFLVSAGTWLLPGCMQDKSGLVFTHFSLSGSQEKMLSALAAAIIPTTNSFIGAADVKAHQFALMMVDECDGPEVQQPFVDGMKAFEKWVDKQYNKKFDALDKTQTQQLLSMLENKTGVEESIVNFYKPFKKYTIQAFTSSSKYMTEVRKYKMVPGSNFKGCVPVAGKV